MALVRDVLHVVLERDTADVDPQEALADLGVDSLALVTVAELVEQRLATGGIALYIPDADLERMTTVGALAGYLQERL